MGNFSHSVVAVSRELARRASAPAQAGLFEGLNPSVYNASDPLPLWVIQIIVIIGMKQLLALVFSRIRQPKVIAEVIGGVFLGPSIMGRIPNFTNAIFPNSSIPILTLTADIGLILFLFLVGMEIDINVMRRNAKSSFAISLAGLVLPLGLGAAVAIPIYHVFTDPSVNFGYFVLFVAVAVGITAFPVLCRILTELKLLDTTVGVVVLAAGVGNDVVGWILLALTVALVNAGKGIVALWVLLTAIGYILFLTIPVRWGYRWVARRTGSLESGRPSSLMMTLTMLVVFVSALFTDIIGIHPIFGGFLAGLIIPHDNGYAIALVEKIEDLVSGLFLPIYFTLSGLRTDLGLLDNGITWGYTILICIVSFFAKFLGSSITAKLSGFNYREAGAIGSLMSCKGLVELIALNVGLSAGILNTRTFSMFVLHAIVLTFITTPLVLLFYPAKYRVHVDTAFAPGKATGHGALEDGAGGSKKDLLKSRFTVVLDRMEQLPTVMTLVQLLQPPSAPAALTSATPSDGRASMEKPTLESPSAASKLQRLSVNALRLVELSERTSTVLKSQAAETLVRTDPILRVLRTFANIHRLALSTALSVVGTEDFAGQIAHSAREASSEMVVIPWSSATLTDDGRNSTSTAPPPISMISPLDALFSSGGDQALTSSCSAFLRGVFADAPVDVALCIDRGLQDLDGEQSDHHIFLPFFGGADDRLALTFVIQLCLNPAVSATIVRVRKENWNELTPVNSVDEVKGVDELPNVQQPTISDTIYDVKDTETRLASSTADDLLWYSCNAGNIGDAAEALSRISFQEEGYARPLRAILDGAVAAIGPHQHRARLVIAAGRSRRLQSSALDAELREVCAERGTSLSPEMPKTVGHVAAAFIAANVSGNLLVLQAQGQ